MKKKLMILAVIVLIVCFTTLYDYIRSRQFEIDVYSIEPQPALADGHSVVTVKARLLGKNRQPVKGHDLSAITYGGGGFKGSRQRTDQNGEVSFIYHPYVASKINPVKDVPIEVRDESNSIIIEINTVETAVIKLKDPEGKGVKSKFNMDDVFGESSDSGDSDAGNGDESDSEDNGDTDSGGEEQNEE